MENQNNNPNNFQDSNTQIPAQPFQQPIQTTQNIQTSPNQPPTPTNPSAIQPNPGNNQAAPSLDNVGGGYGYIFKKYWWFTLPYFAIVVVLFVFSAVFAIILLAVGIPIFKFKYENSLFSAFASSNHFSFTKNGGMDQQNGLIFNIGYSKRFKDCVIGTYKQWPMALFVYIYTVGAGKSTHTFRRAVMSVNFGTPAPAFILRHHSVIQMLENDGESLKSHGYTQEVNLEGNFSQHFKVFIQPNTQDDVLSILTPDVMELVLGLQKYEIELTSNGVFYIYCHGLISKKQSLIDMYRIIESVAPKIGSDVIRKQQISSSITQTIISPDPSSQTITT